MTSPHWCLGSASGAPWKKLMCLFFEDLQRRADQRTMTTALGPDILSFMQSAARWSPGHWVWCWVCPPCPPSELLVCWISPRTACGGSCCCLLFPHPLPENWVEAAGRVSLGRRVVSGCQEKPLTHRRCFPVRREKWL